MQSKVVWVVGAIVVVAVVVLAATQFRPTQKQQQVIPTAQPTPIPTQQASEVKEITISGNEYSFSPNTISLKAGEKVKITFQNTGSLPHNVTIDALGFATNTISGGTATSAEFLADKTGTFTMYCSVGNHRALGMVGEVSIDKQ